MVPKATKPRVHHGNRPLAKNDQDASGEIQSKKVFLVEEDVKLSLNVLELPGVDERIDKTGCWELSSNYIQEQFEKYLQTETMINRVNKSILDTRVHAGLYFIPPTGHGLKHLDIKIMKETAEVYLEKVTNAVVTVFAYFKDAGVIVCLTVMRTV